MQVLSIFQPIGTANADSFNFSANWSSFRVPGVLQRFAISYLFAFLIQWAFHISPANLQQRASNGKLANYHVFCIGYDN